MGRGAFAGLCMQRKSNRPHPGPNTPHIPCAEPRAALTRANRQSWRFFPEEEGLSWHDFLDHCYRRRVWFGQCLRKAETHDQDRIIRQFPIDHGIQRTGCPEAATKSRRLAAKRPSGAMVLGDRALASRRYVRSGVSHLFRSFELLDEVVDVHGRQSHGDD